MALSSAARHGAPRIGFASRRSVAVVASVLAATALAVAVAGRGCRVDEDSPTGVVRLFAQAIRSDDRAALHELFGPSTRAWLDAAAKRATDLVGGSKRFGPLDMIGIGQDAEMVMPEEIELASQNGSHAVVEIVAANGHRSQLELVRIDGRWYIELIGYKAP